MPVGLMAGRWQHADQMPIKSGIGPPASRQKMPDSGPTSGYHLSANKAAVGPTVTRWAYWQRADVGLPPECRPNANQTQQRPDNEQMGILTSGRLRVFNIGPMSGMLGNWSVTQQHSRPILTFDWCRFADIRQMLCRYQVDSLVSASRWCCIGGYIVVSMYCRWRAHFPMMAAACYDYEIWPTRKKQNKKTKNMKINCSNYADLLCNRTTLHITVHISSLNNYPPQKFGHLCAKLQSNDMDQF